MSWAKPDDEHQTAHNSLKQRRHQIGSDLIASHRIAADRIGLFARIVSLENCLLFYLFIWGPSELVVAVVVVVVVDGLERVIVRTWMSLCTFGVGLSETSAWLTHRARAIYLPSLFERRKKIWALVQVGVLVLFDETGNQILSKASKFWRRIRRRRRSTFEIKLNWKFCLCLMTMID